MYQVEYKHLLKNIDSEHIQSHILESKNWTTILTEDFEVEPIQVPSQLSEGDLIDLNLKRFNFVCQSQFKVEHVGSNSFCYKQTKGIFKRWTHKISWHSDKKNKGINLLHKVEYKLPYGVLGTLFQDLFFRFDLPSLLATQSKKIEQSLLDQ